MNGVNRMSAVIPSSPSHVVRIEAEALMRLADRLDGAMRVALDQVLTLLAETSAAGHRIALTGIGKSGLIARKIAATLNSTGTSACFLHPVEALHGDLGMLRRGDLIVALSYSGETEELLRLLPVFARLGMPVVSFTGSPSSTLAIGSVATLDVSVSEEACSLNLAPTASTTTMLALGDALAVELSRRSGFQPDDFADLHPGGPLGRRLARVRDLMHSGDALPQVTLSTPMPEVIHEMSRKRLGMTTVVNATPNERNVAGHTLAGIISDGDLRRLLERVGPYALDQTAGDIMNRMPQTISAGAFASAAMAQMEEKKITSLVVVQDGQVEGVIHLHDLLRQTRRDKI
jgi:arabinose-5-phosphate isomerase